MMYGQEYLEWCEGEACHKELVAFLGGLERKHESKAFDHAITKRFPAWTPELSGAMSQLLAAQRSAAGISQWHPLQGLRTQFHQAGPSQQGMINRLFGIGL